MSRPDSVPVLETPRLMLRRHELSDVDDAFVMWSDPQVVRHVGGRVFNHEEVWARVCRYVGHWALYGFGYWCVREKGGGFVGEVGFGDFRRQLDPPLEHPANDARGPEAGWALARTMQGKGYAREAVGATLAWADARFPRTVCMIEPNNARSTALATAVGFTELARAQYHGEDTVVFARHARAKEQVRACP